MLLKYILRRSKKFIKYQGLVPSAYYACTLVAPQSPREAFVASRYSHHLLRPLATSSHERFDIDFVTMKVTKSDPTKKQMTFSTKKGKKNKAKNAGNIVIDADFVDVFRVGLEALEKVLFPKFIKLLLADKEHGIAERFGTKEEAYSMLAFVRKHYEELKDFEAFLKTKYNSSMMESSFLSSSEMMENMAPFRDFYSKYKEVNIEKVGKYELMEDNLLWFLEEYPKFPQLLSNELIPTVEYYHKVKTFFENSLHWFDEELRALDKEFNFKKLKSVSGLTDHIDRTLAGFEDFLSSNTEVNETFFKILIQCARYDVLNAVLKELPDLTLKDIRAILKDPKYKALAGCVYGESLKILMKPEESTKLLKRLAGKPYTKNFDRAGPLYRFLLAMGLVPVTPEFYKLAPVLYKVSKQKDIYGQAARNLLRILTDQEVAAPKDLRECLEVDYENPNFDITKDKLANYVLNILELNDFPLERAKNMKDLEYEEWFPENRYEESFVDLLLENSALVDKILSDPNVAEEYEHFLNYPNVPPKCAIWQDTAVLDSLRRQLGLSFLNFDDLSELFDAIRGLGPQYEDVCSHILEASRYFQGSTLVLDYLVDHSLQCAKEENAVLATKGLHKAVPNFISLDKYLPEIIFLKEEVGNFANKDYVLSSLEDLEEVMITNSSPHQDVESFLKFSEKLVEFSDNNISSCFLVLDTILLDHGAYWLFDDVIGAEPKAVAEEEEVFEAEPEPVAEEEVVVEAEPKPVPQEEEVIEAPEIEAEQETVQTTPYVQIPDDLSLHEFAHELNALRSVLGRPFSQISAEEILNVLENEIDNSFTSGGSRSSLLASNASDVFNFLRLKRRLHRLFDVNGNNTESLDVLLQNQAVFDSFEASKKPAEYKQIPNDFVLEEYFIELTELKKVLGVARFEEVSADTVLKKIRELSEDESTTIAKSLIWSKLYRNLSMLFKHNHGATFVLDNVIGSAQEYLRFESNRVETERAQSAIGSQGALLSGSEYEVLGVFLRYSDLLYRSDVHKVSAKQFDEMVDRFEESLDKTSSTYLFTKSVLDQLKKYNADIEFYPPFIVCIYGTNCFGDFPMSPIQLEAFYDDLVRSLNEIIAEEKEISQSDTVSEKFDIGDFATNAKKKTQYNDSEKIISDLDKESSGADFEAVQQAIHSAFEEPPEPIFVPNTLATKKDTKPERKSAKPLKSSPSSHDVDISKLKKYLQDARKQEESRVREREAYEWSQKAEIDAKQAKMNSKYCILTLEGEVMPISGQALEDLPKEDIFKTLNKFSKEELSKASEVVKDLQARNWKVVGSRIEGDKRYLVLMNNDSTGRAYKTLRSILATTGLVFLTVLGVNLWVDESDQFNKAIAEYEKKEKEEQASAAGPFSVATVASPTIFGKEYVSGVVEPAPEAIKKEEDSSLSWWQRLLWTK
ncbi:hypothetical protein Cantr_10545 [Candida viswanathii]|uniref:Uncharacterized protein n=1 Tax=Candida viswanathii TaxID=5486 RepID=A0A367YDB6_9ASCO|nr:hypothetical protein Cantr_10545 [Candida viswanathii]